MHSRQSLGPGSTRDRREDISDELCYEPVNDRDWLSEAPFLQGGYVFGATDLPTSRMGKTGPSRHERIMVDEISPHELGSTGESVASDYLEQKGYLVVERNWICPCGEADIVCMDGDTCVLVEVKTRLAATGEQPLPELAVGMKKRERYRRIAECYLDAHEVGVVRFDVIAITIEHGHEPKIHHVVGAFACDD